MIKSSKKSNRKLEVVFDIDGVLNTMTETACDELGINPTDLIQYEISTNPRLTEDNKNNLYRLFGDVEFFKRIYVIPEISRLKEIQDTGRANVSIHSLSWNREIAEFKKQMLRERLNWLPRKRVILEVNGVDSIKNDTENCDILVEDCITNIVKSKPRNMGILIKKSYNRPETYNIDVKEHNITEVNSLNEAIDKILGVLSNGYTRV